MWSHIGWGTKAASGGSIAENNRQFINAIFWMLRTGAPWRDLPPDYGGWSNTHRRFIHWRDARIWEKLLEILIDEPDYEWLIIDADHLITDKGYDTDALLEQVAAQGRNVVIPPKKNRTVQRPSDEELYKFRHLVQNAFLVQNENLTN